MERAGTVRSAFVLTILFLAGLTAVHLAAQPQNSFHFAIIGDRTGGADPQIYDRVWREVDSFHPDFVINVGDTIEGGDNQRAGQEWLALRSMWSRYSRYPLYFTPGNHDIFSEVSRKLYEKETGRPASYSFNFQNAHFTVLDNSGSDELPDAEIEFLRRDLEQNKSRSPKFVFFHRPFWIPYVMFRNREFPLHQIAKKYGVGYVISGHMHQFMRMAQDGVVYIVVGSSGASMRRGLNAGQGFEEGWFYHHVRVSVTGVAVNMTVKEIDTGAAKGRSFNADEWKQFGAKSDRPAATHD